MGLRDLAESQLACAQEAAAAEAKARQSVYVTESVAMCKEWFLSVLKTEPEEIVCTSKYDAYRPRHECRALCDGEWFAWCDDINAYREHGLGYEDKPPVPGVRLVENRRMFRNREDSPMRWEPVLTTYSYTGYLYATSLPMLAQHLRAVDKVRAKDQARKETK